MRFSRMVLEEVRSKVGDEFVIGVRMPMSEGIEGGLTKDDCLEIAMSLEETGLIDFVNLNHGHIDTAEGLAAYMPGMGSRLAPFLEMAGEFKRQLNLPVFHACRVSDVSTARYAVSSGLVDMIGMTRAHMADPHIVEKIRTGREDQVRPCVGATYCLDQRVCIHNAATGREEALPHLVPPSASGRKKVVVVGGGPAGLEAARVCAMRGHDVVLFEAAARIGGQVLLAANATWRRDLIGIVDWLGSECERLGVDIRLNAYADGETVLLEAPDVVIIATGGLPDMNQLDQGGRCASVWDVLSGTAPVSGNVLVYDGTGRHAAISCADYLASRHAKVELATPERAPGPEVGTLEIPVFLKRLDEMGGVLTPNVTLVAAEPGDQKIRVVLRNDYSGIEVDRSVDWLVIDYGTLPADDLYTELRGNSLNRGVTDIDALIHGLPQPFDTRGRAGFLLFRVGDAVASRNIHAAILASLRVCKDI
jgi:NADH:flavin oxidoreductase / NADH oxidase family/NAD(P)-binding Rossmann-like domain